MAHHFRFTRLSVLSLSYVLTTIPLFTRFLDTARPTLRELNLGSVCWTSDRQFEKTERDAPAQEAVRVARLVYTYLRDFPGLRRLRARNWTYQGREVRMREINSPDHRNVVLFDEWWAAISLGEWIDHLQFAVK
ncbi:hypothetical protein BDW59DRAFT_154272 [Aspergillus cavernicola]|uniref:Uncharacterized protein n=1 Tax=Aspergillus cavernicola TaxID=176166 RepID=A0ABR4HGE9_9EURO